MFSKKPFKVHSTFVQTTACSICMSLFMLQCLLPPIWL